MPSIFAFSSDTDRVSIAAVQDAMQLLSCSAQLTRVGIPVQLNHAHKINSAIIKLKLRMSM
jgi:hypothetical protein